MKYLLLLISISLIVKAASNEFELVFQNETGETLICNAENCKSVAEFILCIKRRQQQNHDNDYQRDETYSQRAPPVNPCRDYVKIDQEARRVDNVLNELTSAALCDRALKTRWYRFVGRGGTRMPEACPRQFSCGTHAPIWLSGQHPTSHITAKIGVCASLNGNCCSERWDIDVKSCEDFYVYKLSAAPGCFMAYCAGNETECPAGQSSLTGYSPGCSAVFPELDGIVNLDFKRSNTQVLEFFCDYEGHVPNDVECPVEWYAESAAGEKTQLWTDIAQVTPRNRRLRSTLLQEKLVGKMGSLIWCQMQARYKDGRGVPSPILKSKTHFAGIKILNRAINVSESESANYIHLQSTVPVLCLPEYQDNCELTIQIAVDEAERADRCIGGQIREVVFGDCVIKITPQNWEQIHSIPIKAVRDFHKDGNQVMRVNFRPIYSTMASLLWNNYQLPSVEVISLDMPTHMCSTTGDPHFQTFDQLSYNIFMEGEFVLYKHTRLPLQINVRIERCGDTATCSCGVGVMAADDVVVIDRCRRRSRNLAFGTHFPDGWNTLHRHALQQGDSFTHGLKIYEYDDGRKYTVHLSTGAYIDFEVSEYWINVFLHGSSDDWQSTQGLCGTFNGNKRDDFTFRNGWSGQIRENGNCGNDHAICDFANNWRVPSSQSLFEKIVTVTLQSLETFDDHKYCKCQRSDDNGHDDEVVCNYNDDIANCQSDRETVYGNDITHNLLDRRQQAHENRRRRRRSIQDDNVTATLDDVTDDDDDDEYFNSEFIHDVNFIGSDPGWPTPSGLTEDQIREYCTEEINKSSLMQKCGRFVSTKLGSIIANCILDVQVMDDLKWTSSALDDLRAECLQEVYAGDEALWENSFSGEINSQMAQDQDHGQGLDSTVIADASSILELACPGDCHVRGTCFNGTCHCSAGYHGSDCSVEDSAQPKILFLGGGGICDLHLDDCRLLSIYGKNFQKKKLRCLLRLIDEPGVKIRKTKATFETFEEVTCPIPERIHTISSPAQDDALAGSRTMSKTAISISIAIGGSLISNEKILVLYDSTCQSCENLGSSYKCNQTENTCLVEGSCYKAGEKHPSDCCSRCNPSLSTILLTKFLDNQPPVFEPATSEYTIVASDQERQFHIRAMDPENCDVTLELKNPDDVGPPLIITKGQRDVTFSVENFKVGTYNFTLRASDGCGATNELNVKVILVDDINTLLQSTTDAMSVKQLCKERNRRKTVVTSISVKAARGQLMNFHINSKLSEEERLPLDQSYYIVEATNTWMSMSKNGVFRYSAPFFEIVDNVEIVSEDACGNRVFRTLSISTR